MFPEAQFIILHRHGLDQAHSWSRGGTLLREQFEHFCQDGEDVRVGALRYWREQTEAICDFQKTVPNKCHVMQYEQVCAEPESRLERMFAFLDEEWEPGVLQFYEFPHDRGPEDGRVPGTSGFDVHKEYFKSWPPTLVKQCVRVAEPVLDKLGYSV